MEVLRLEGLSKFYTTENSVVVGLSGLNLSFSVGEFVAITGESGSGKSTLAHVLGGILPYESGELYIYGEPTSHYDAYDRAEYRRDLIGFISQSYDILPGNTVIENVESALRFSGLSPEDAASRADAILERVELGELKGRRASKLSSGQKQRLSIARALAKPSKILIADEPTGNLDRENSEKMIALLKAASEDRLVILITHEYEEARASVTRHIVLSDGAVISDSPVHAEVGRQSMQVAHDKKAGAQERGKHAPLVPYVCRLTAKARPVFSVTLCILLTITALITFIFLGTLITAVDDSATKIYDSTIFANGSPERIVVMKSDSSTFSDEDYLNIVSKKYAEHIERFGYVNDFSYHYKKEIDHDSYEIIEFGPNYHPVLNPSDYALTTTVEFKNTDQKYIQTLPFTEESIINKGRAPEGIYEILSADPEWTVGETVTVYVRNQNKWSVSEYLKLDFTVVGETDYGNGFYFSDLFAAVLSKTKTIYTAEGDIRPRMGSYICLPLNPAFLPGGVESYTVTEGELMFPKGTSMVRLDLYDSLRILDAEGNTLKLKCTLKFDSPSPKLIVLSDTDFYKTIKIEQQDQISLYIRDYAYMDRVIGSLTEDGYIAVSPYRLGATETDPKLQNERMITLAICGAALLFAFALQCILLRILFSPLYEHYRLMSSTGLTARDARLSLSMLLLLYAFIAELVCAAIVLLLNFLSVERIVDLFKYFEPGMIFLLFALHFVSVAVSLIGILRGLRKSVFRANKTNFDIDFHMMEEGAV